MVQARGRAGLCQGTQYNLGNMYANGEGVAQDDAAAVKWFRMAAEQGYANAQFNLGLMYAKGRGVVQDYLLSHMWGNLAAKNGNDKAIELRDAIAKIISPSDISKAQAMARECVKSSYKNCG